VIGKGCASRQNEEGGFNLKTELVAKQSWNQKGCESLSFNWEPYPNIKHEHSARTFSSGRSNIGRIYSAGRPFH
jgi:hypothetical protein